LGLKSGDTGRWRISGLWRWITKSEVLEGGRGGREGGLEEGGDDGVESKMKRNDKRNKIY